MIYALVEPSIYMIASILPTTRHLYRRARRQLRKAKSDDNGPKNSNNLRPSPGLERVDNSDKSGVFTRHLDIWQAKTDSSQEELTLGGWYRDRQVWNQSKPADTTLSTTLEAPNPVSNSNTRP
jgi:hypothetical protein